MSVFAFVPYALFLVAFGFRLAGVRPAMLAWAILMLGALSGLFASVIFLISGGWSLWDAAVVAVVPFVLTVAWVARDLAHPLINDVTTDTDHPPDFVFATCVPGNVGRDMSFPEKNAAILRRHYPQVRPLEVENPPSVTLDKAAAIMDARRGWRITHRDDAAGLLEAEVTTSGLGFVDDVLVRVVAFDDGSRVDMRSKSREGLVDGGANARRIVAFLGQLAKQPDAIRQTDNWWNE